MPFYGYENSPAGIKDLLDEIVENFRRVLRDNLVGIYLHGSLAMGCFNPDYSDLDFLVVVRESLNVEKKKEIVDFTLRISKSKNVPKKGLEFSVVLQDVLENFEYPTPFELHYSKMWESDYEKGKVDYTKKNRDPDLAAHVTIILSKGIRLFGKPIEEAFHPIPEEYYVRSILQDVEDIRADVTADPVYSVLNLCRVLYYLKERVISSKAEAGIWALENTSSEFKELIETALGVYRGEINEVEWDEKIVRDFMEYMQKNIESLKNTLT